MNVYCHFCSIQLRTDSMNICYTILLPPMLRSLAIFVRGSMSGCEELVHHLETVDGLTPSSSDNHLLVFFCSTNTNFRRFTSCITFDLLFGCKVSEKYSINSTTYSFFSESNFIYVSVKCLWLVNYTIRMGNFPLCDRNYTEKMGCDIAVDLNHSAFSTA